MFKAIGDNVAPQALQLVLSNANLNDMTHCPLENRTHQVSVRLIVSGRG